MDPDLWLPLALALPFAAMLLVPALHRLHPRSPAVAGVAAGGGSLFLLLLQWVATGPATATFPWIPSANIAFTLRLDAVSLLFALLVTGIGALIFAYAYEYMAHEAAVARAFYGYNALFMGSMLGLVLSGDLILLFVFWELTTISSFLLIGLHRDEPASVASALKALVLTGIGGLALLLAVLLLGLTVGTFDLGAVLAAGDTVRASPAFLPILALLVVAVATKSAQFPLHVWLPDAMVAPTPVSAYLHSAAMVKAGIFLLARFLPPLVSVAWESVLLPLGMVTMLVGGLLALRATDLKRILAYSTVSQLGLLVAAFAVVGVAGQKAGYYHLLNHAFFKASLFLVAGAVTLATGIKDIRKLGGLGRRMPLTAAACGLAALSMAGVPPLGGFLSKEFFFDATLATGLLWVPVVAVVGGGLTFAYSLHFFVRIFLGSGEAAEARDVPVLAVPALVLAGLTLLLGLAPELLAGVVAAAVVAPEPVTLRVGYLDLSATGLLMSLGSALLGLALYARYGGVAALLAQIGTRLGRFTPDGAYEAFIGNVRAACKAVGLAVQNGSLRRYTSLLLLFVLVALLWPMGLPPPELPTLAGERDLAIALVLLAVVVFAALAAFLTDTLHAVLSLAGMGFATALVFMLLNAPDLAMTQILVELVLFVIFLIVLYKVPASALKPVPRRGPLDAFLAAGIVLAVAFVAASALAVFYYPSMALGFLDPALVDETGGRNLVNVILTDFRAFDTLGEITVIVLAALAVYTLLRRRSNG